MVKEGGKGGKVMGRGARRAATCSCACCSVVRAVKEGADWNLQRTGEEQGGTCGHGRLGPTACVGKEREGSEGRGGPEPTLRGVGEGRAGR